MAGAPAVPSGDLWRSGWPADCSGRRPGCSGRYTCTATTPCRLTGRRFSAPTTSASSTRSHRSIRLDRPVHFVGKADYLDSWKIWSRDGLLHKGYTGGARLAVAAGCPILPVGITGTDQSQPPGARIPRPRKECTVSIGSQIPAPFGGSRWRSGRGASADRPGDARDRRAQPPDVRGALLPRSAPRTKPSRHVRWSPRRLAHA